MNKQHATDWTTLSLYIFTAGKITERERKRKKREWWGDRSVAEKDERFWWREETEEGGLERQKKRQIWRIEVMGASEWAPRWILLRSVNFHILMLRILAERRLS